MAKEKGVSFWVKLFVVFHAVGISVWCLPNPRPAIQNGAVEPFGTDWILYYNWKYLKTLKPFRFYMNTAGVWQYWDMFAPNPSDTDLYGDAEVVYQDGSVRRYPYYRMYEMPIPVKYYRERFRKFFERASMDELRFLWAPFAQRVALEMDTDPANPPVRVRLYRYTQRLLGPGKPVPTQYQKDMYYEHEVDANRLARVQGRAGA